MDWPPALPDLLRPLGPSTLGPVLTVPTALFESGGPVDAKDLLGIVRALHSIDLLPERLQRLTKACFCTEKVDAASFSQGPDPVVLEKPAGWEVYGGHGQLQLRDKLIRSAGNYPIFHDATRDLGFIHRLDVPSSGLILAAKTYRTHSYLQLQLHTGVLLREYFVVSHGWLPPARRAISAALDDDAETTRAGVGKAALTKLKVQVQCHLEGEAFTAVAVQLGTGRKHQIRSHLAHVGHPVVRDGRYSSSASFCGDGRLCNSNFLHRQRLAFFDSSGKWHDAKAPLPSLLATALESLRERRATSTGLLQQCTGDVQSWDVLQTEAQLEKGGYQRGPPCCGQPRGVLSHFGAQVYARLMAIRALAPLAARHVPVQELIRSLKLCPPGVNGGELSARLSAVKALAAETPDSAAAAVLGTCLEDWHAAVQKAAACGLEKFVGKAGSDPAASKAIEAAACAFGACISIHHAVHFYVLPSAFSARALRGDRSGLTALMTALERDDASPTWRQALGALAGALNRQMSMSRSGGLCHVNVHHVSLPFILTEGGRSQSHRPGPQLRSTEYATGDLVEAHTTLARRPMNRGHRLPNGMCSGSSVSDAKTYTRSIQQLGKQLEWQKSLRLLREFRQSRCDGAVHAYSAGITATGDWHRAVDLLNDLQNISQANVVTFSSAISACEKISAWQPALLLLGQAEDAFVEADVIVFNAVASACQKGSDWQRAAELMDALFRQALEPTIVSHSTVISAWGRASRWQVALRLLRALPLFDLQVNRVAYGATLSACEASSNWQLALELFAEVRSQSLKVNLIIANTVISSCEKAAEWEAALLLLSNLTLQPQHPQPDEISFNSAISACEKAGQWHWALELLNQLDRNRLQASVVSCSAAASACAKGTAWLQAMFLISSSQKSKIQLDVIAYTALASACAQGYSWQTAVCLVADLRQSYAHADLVTCNAVITACAEGRRWLTATTMLRNFQTEQLRSDEVSICAAITACQQEWPAAVHVLSLFRSSLPASRVAFNAAAAACEKGSSWQLALLFAKVRLQRLTPDAVSYNVAIRACQKEESWQWAMLLLHELWDSRLRASVITYSVAIGAAHAAGRWAWALHFLQRLDRDGEAPNVITFNAVLSTCAGQHRWQRTLSLLSRVGVREDVVTHATAVAACEVGLRYSDAASVLSRMDSAGVAANHRTVGRRAVCGGQRQLMSRGDGRVHDHDLCGASATECREGRDDTWQLAKRQLWAGVRNRIRADVVSLTAAGSASLRNRQWQSSLQLLGERGWIYSAQLLEDGMEGRRWEVAMNLLERAVSSKVEADVCTLTAALSNFNWEDPWHWSLQCFGLLRRQHLQTNAVASATAAKAFELSTHWAPALALLSSLARDGCRPCAATGLAACGACGQVSSWERSLHISLSGAPARVASCARGTAWCLALFVAAVPERRREVARVSLNAAMSALGRIELWQTVAGMLSQMSRRQIVPDIISHNSVISAMLHSWEDALAILRLLGGCGGLVSSNAALRSMARAAQWPLALQLMLAMRRRARAIAGITWNSVLSACENDGQWPVALLLLHGMPQLRVLLDLFGRNSAISASEKGSQWAVALRLLQASDHGVEADVLSFGSVVAACRTPDLWRVAASACHQMRAVQVRPDVVACSAALSALGNAAKWRQAAEVCANSEAMQEQDLPYNAAVWAFAQGERRAQQLS
ncbi:Pentatricopeptide repeat-containing protein, chloroplastic [Symbiodinium microadriaticum]|uniref:Pentatricopeptide repeat-containing protein, chloroplastic n=1 Tax=Symbiodinium microadriaticum TaxID=2951 RepID=A0A1Q9CWS7_SYMMI|nr:Pentatricopeptide repeat-containing protein, chloroplastic [Symbiodinium microadriaticum]